MAKDCSERVVTDPLRLALLAWFDAQLAEFKDTPRRWRAEIVGEGTEITGNFSKRHQVSARTDGTLVIDGQVCRLPGKL